MKKLEVATIELVTKYPFLTDPIVLFNPSTIPSKEEVLSGKLSLDYPEINKNQKRLSHIKKDFFDVIHQYHNTKFKDLYIKVEFGERLKDFHKVIRIIEIFYDEEEYEKFNLINEYFGIDFELLEKIFKNKDVIEDFFCENDKKLDDDVIKKLSKKKLKKEEVKFYFEEALKFHGLEKNWTVVIKNAISVVHTNFREDGGDIIIPTDYKPRSIRDTLVLIAHEIDGHCIQFTNCDCLSGGSIRYSKSESLAEGFAMYNQYLFENNLFGAGKKVSAFIKKNKTRLETFNNSTLLPEYIKIVNNNGFRFFRGFHNIDEYKNLKDFVYIQGLYKIIKLTSKYSNTIKLIKSGAVNFSYIDKHGIKTGRRKRVYLRELSAYHILQEYFLK